MSINACRIVLVSPGHAGNVGAACRAMANMGLAKLTVTAPRFTDWEPAQRMACHATDILEARTVCDTLDEAIADCAAVVGTSARGGLYRAHVRSPREWAPEITTLADQGPVALVFGREDNGLSNAEIALCTHLIRIPTAAAYSSLNLAQAVLICAYELFLATDEYAPPQEKSDLAPFALRERMVRMWHETLLAAGFMEPAKADHMMQGIRRIFARGARTRDDVDILIGMARQLEWAVRHDQPSNPPTPETPVVRPRPGLDPDVRKPAADTPDDPA